jgi:hypothetical protein
MDSKYEWRDETGLGHPSLVFIDVTGLPDEITKDIHQFESMAEKVIKVKQIDSFNDVFQRGGIWAGKKFIPAGWKFEWYHMEMNADCYAIFFAVSKI